MFHLVLSTVLHASLALANPGDATPNGTIPSLPFLRGVSIEKPTQLAFDHGEYEWVDWGSCKELLAPYASETFPFAHSFLSMLNQEDGKRAGDRAACMTAAVLKRFPHLNAVRVPIEPGVVLKREKSGHEGASRKSSSKRKKLGDDGVFFFKKRRLALDCRYVQDLIEPILEVVKKANDQRTGVDGGDRIWVILDWHYIADGNGLGRSGRPWMFQQVAEPTRQFWALVGDAGWMKSYENIIFEVFNEPVLNKENGEPRQDEFDEWSRGLSEIVSGLRESGNGKDRPIAIPAPWWSGRCQRGLVDDGEGIFQVEHRYTDHGTLDPCDGSKAPKRPVLVTEVGGNHEKGSPPDRVDEVRGLLERYQGSRTAVDHPIGGWIAWVYGSSNNRPSLLASVEGKGTHTFLNVPLSASGEAVLAVLSQPLPAPSPNPASGTTQGQAVGLQPAAEP